MAPRYSVRCTFTANCSGQSRNSATWPSRRIADTATAPIWPINQPLSSVNTHSHGQPYVLPASAFFEIRDCKVARTTNDYNLPHWIEAVSR